MTANTQLGAFKRTPWRNYWLVTPLLIAAINLAACSTGGNATAATTQEAAGAPTVPAAAPTERAAASTPTSEAPAAAPMTTKLNLNTATSEEFMTIPGMGNRMVHEFEEYRPYVSIQQFRREIGKYVDESQVAEYEKYVFVPVSANEADAETLQQLPGVDAALAETLIASRPFASNAAFLEKLGESVSADDAASSAAYLAAE